jgi:putative sterol carrier protein
MRYLSAEWIAAVSAAVAANSELQLVAAQHTVGLTQVVTGTPSGDVTYHLQSRGGIVRFSSGVAEPEDVRFTEPYETAVAVSTGALNAQEAFISGQIKFVGDHQRLIHAADLFAALNPVFEAVRLDTTY